MRSGDSRTAVPALANEQSDQSGGKRPLTADRLSCTVTMRSIIPAAGELASTETAAD